MNQKPSAASIQGRKPIDRSLSPAAAAVSVWAHLKNLWVMSAVKVGRDGERAFFNDNEYELLLLTNRTVKIRTRGKLQESHIYVPLENVRSYEALGDESVHTRIKAASRESSTGAGETTEDNREDGER